MAADINSLFGGTSTKETTNTFSLGDYASIRNGSYKKLVKAYYKKQNDEKSSDKAEKTDKQLVSVKSDADNFAKSTAKLMDSKLYEKNEKGEYDWDKITGAVKQFVDDYNSIVGKVGNSDDKGILRNGVWMTGQVKANEKLLSNIGITIGSDNKLTFNADKMKEAHMTTIQHMFTGANSFASDMLRRAGQISNVATQSAGQKSSATAYTSSGDYEKLLTGGLSYDAES